MVTNTISFKPFSFSDALWCFIFMIMCIFKLTFLGAPIKLWTLLGAFEARYDNICKQWKYIFYEDWNCFCITNMQCYFEVGPILSLPCTDNFECSFSIHRDEGWFVRTFATFPHLIFMWYRFSTEISSTVYHSYNYLHNDKDIQLSLRNM